MQKSVKQSINFILIVLFIGLISCNSLRNPPESKRQIAFHKFIKKLKILPAPFFLEAGEINRSVYSQVEVEDTLFMKDGSSFYYGLLPDTSNFFAVIMLSVSDSYIPILTTFDKTGKKIDSQSLQIYECGSGPSEGYCSSKGTIGKDNHIHCIDSVYYFEVDSNVNKIVGTRQLIRNTLDGKISPDGSIKLKVVFTDRYCDLSKEPFDIRSPFVLTSSRHTVSKDSQSTNTSHCLNWTISDKDIKKCIVHSKEISKDDWQVLFSRMACEVVGGIKQNNRFYSYRVNASSWIEIGNRDTSIIFGNFNKEDQKCFLDPPLREKYY